MSCENLGKIHNSQNRDIFVMAETPRNSFSYDTAVRVSDRFLGVFVRQGAENPRSIGHYSSDTEMARSVLVC